MPDRSTGKRLISDHYYHEKKRKWGFSLNNQREQDYRGLIHWREQWEFIHWREQWEFIHWRKQWEFIQSREEDQWEFSIFNQRQEDQWQFSIFNQRQQWVFIHWREQDQRWFSHWRKRFLVRFHPYFWIEDHLQIQPTYLRFVSKRPNSSGHMNKILEKCANVCESYMQDGNCACHCMRDSESRLVGCCAKPDIFFVYCPEDDPVDQTFQKDPATLFNSTIFRNYNNSSDVCFCDLNDCIQLHRSSNRSGKTPPSTLISRTTKMNGWAIYKECSEENWFVILLFVVMGIYVDYVNLRKSGISSGTLSLASILFPCAVGTDLGNGQQEKKVHSQIYQASLKFVSKCPISSEYMNKTLEKCVDVCGSYIQDGNCAYHCMRDSSKTRLVECCAKPKILFDYCPEYDPVDQTIQKDISTKCNSNFSRSYYNSSDIYFCDPNHCLQLNGSSDRFGETTMMTRTTETNVGNVHKEWSAENWFLILLFVVIGIVVAFVIAFIIYKSGIFATRARKEKNPNNVENGVNEQLMG